MYSDNWSALDIAIFSNYHSTIFLMNRGANFIKSREFEPNRIKVINFHEYFENNDCGIQEPLSNFPKNSSKSFAEKLSLCVIHNRLDLLKTLIKDTDYLVVNEKGNNILSQSIESYQMEIFDFIIKNLNWKEMINMKNNKELLPLHMALQRRNYHVIRTFCSLTENPMKMDHLCFKKTRNHKELFEYLKQWNIYKTKKNSNISFHFE
jgi:hypothetical protein